MGQGRLGHPPAPFIVGVARSGTTLLRLMLDAHPLVAIPPETHLFSEVVTAFRSSRDPLAEAERAVLESPRWQDFGIPARDFHRRLAGLRPAGPGEFLRTFYLLYAERAGKERWGDKTPVYLDRMVPIQAVLPEARFVHLIRDGRDVAVSIAPLWWGPSEPGEIAAWWAERLAFARRQAAELRWYREIRYEDLVADPPGVLQSVCDFLELPWHASMLEYYKGARERILGETGDVRTPEGRLVRACERTAIHAFVGCPPIRDRVERWRVEMPEAALRDFERTGGDALEASGYQLSTRRA